MAEVGRARCWAGSSLRTGTARKVSRLQQTRVWPVSAADSKGAGGAGGCASEERVCGPVGREERSGVVCLPREDVWCRLVPSGGAAGLWRVAAGDTAEQGTCTAAAPTTERGGGHRPARPQPRKPEVEGTAEAEAPRKSRAEFGGGAGSWRGGRGLRPSKRARWFQVLLCRREDLLSRHASRPPETDMVPGTRERPVQSPKPPGLAG